RCQALPARGASAPLLRREWVIQGDPRTYIDSSTIPTGAPALSDRTGKVFLDRVDRDIEGAGDLGVGHAVALSQHEDGAIQGWQLPEHRLELLGQAQPVAGVGGRGHRW